MAGQPQSRGADNAVTLCTQTLIHCSPTQQHSSLAFMKVCKQVYSLYGTLISRLPRHSITTSVNRWRGNIGGWLYITSVVFWQQNTLSVTTLSSPTESSQKDYFNLLIFSFRAICSEGSKLWTSYSYKKYRSRSMIWIEITLDSSFILIYNTVSQIYFLRTSYCPPLSTHRNATSRNTRLNTMENIHSHQFTWVYNLLDLSSLCLNYKLSEFFTQQNDTGFQ